MEIRWLLAALHLLALGVGLGAVWGRTRSLRGHLDATALRRVFYADNWWGIAAVVWVATGFARAFGGFEKGGAYYLHSRLFWIKMGLLAIILVLEVIPMITLIRWRIQLRRGRQPDTTVATRLVKVGILQTSLVVLMVLVATAMARGFDVPNVRAALSSVAS